MDVKSVSFGSTYRINLKFNNWDSMRKLYGFADSLRAKNAKIHNELRLNDRIQTIVIDDKEDKFVENFLAKNFINFIKRTKAFLFSEHGIKNRMRVNPQFKERYLPNLVEIKTQKFDKAFKESSPWQYVGDYPTLSHKERYDDFREYIKKDLPINAPEVYVRDLGNQPVITFQDGRHRYAFLRDMGFATIPVSMSKDSYETAMKYGLI